MPIIVDKKEKKAKILEAAIHVFSQQGLRNTKISDISEEAGIGKGTIYEYFRSKDEIFNASFAYFMEKIEEIIARRLFKIHDPLDKFKAYFESWIEVLVDHCSGFLEIMLDFWAEGIREREEHTFFDMEKLYEENIQVLDSILSECVSHGQIRQVDTRLTASALLGTLDGILLQMILFKGSYDGAAAVRQFIDVMIEGLRPKS